MTQRSMYELLNGANSAGNPDLALNAANSDFVLAKQRFVWDFTPIRGDSTDAWTEDNNTGTWAMSSDGIKGTITSGQNTNAMIHFGDKMPFDATSSIFIASVKAVNTDHSSHWFRCGFGGTSYTSNSSLFSAHSQNTNFEFYQNSGVSINTGVPRDENFHTVKIENTSSSAILSIDGSLRVTDTANLSTGKQQPIFQLWRAYNTDPSPECYIRYVECYNT